MAYSKIQIPGNGTNGPFTVSFALGYLSQSEVTARVNAEVDGLGAPAYRTITWLDVELVNISGIAPTALDTITFERTVSKTVLKHDFADGAPIIERNLDESHKQAIMIAQEALDGRFGALQGDLDLGNHKIINVLDPTSPQHAATKAYIDLQVISAGNVPAPTAPDVGKVITATGVGTYAWGSPVTVPDATDTVAGKVEYTSDAEVAAGVSPTDRVIKFAQLILNFARLAVVQTFSRKQTISLADGVDSGLPLELIYGNVGGPNLYLRSRKAGAGADSDEIGQIEFQGKSSTTADRVFAFIDAIVTTAADATRAGQIRLVAVTNAIANAVMLIGNGVQIGAPTGGYKGLGTLNYSGKLYENGNGVAGPSACYAFESTGDGGTSIATTWTTAVLNTTRWNNLGPGNGALASNQVTLLAGRYRVRAQKQFYSTGGTTLIRLFNVTDGTLIVNGPNFGLATGGYDMVAEVPTHEFTIAGTKVIRTDYYVQAANATTGLGNSTGVPASHNNTYGYLYIERIE